MGVYGIVFPTLWDDVYPCLSKPFEGKINYFFLFHEEKAQTAAPDDYIDFRFGICIGMDIFSDRY